MEFGWQGLRRGLVSSGSIVAFVCHLPSLSFSDEDVKSAQPSFDWTATTGKVVFMACFHGLEPFRGPYGGSGVTPRKMGFSTITFHPSSIECWTRCPFTDLHPLGLPRGPCSGPCRTSLNSDCLRRSLRMLHVAAKGCERSRVRLVNGTGAFHIRAYRLGIPSQRHLILGTHELGSSTV